MKKITCILLFAVLFIYAKPINSKLLSSKIANKESSFIKNKKSYLVGNWKYLIKSYSKFRVEIDLVKLIRPSLNNDTLFILQDYDLSGLSRNLSIAVWNKNKEFFYVKTDTIPPNNPLYNKLNYRRMQLFQADKKYNLFPDHMINLVSKWDIDNIKKEEQNNGIIGGSSKVAIRIIFKNKRYKIDCFVFRDFFNFKRDQAPFTSRPELLTPVP